MSDGGFRAVNGVSFALRSGEAFGFLGPNGAGKSSTMRMIGCVSPVSGGTLRVLGMDPPTHGRQIRARLGVVPQDDALDRELTVRENLLIYGRYFGLAEGGHRRAGRATARLRPTGRQGGRAGRTRSRAACARRLTIARSLINEPDILLLDEPTTGLDPQARHVLWDRLFRLKQQGVTLVLTTHYMDEAEQLCDRLVVMDGGVIVAEGSPRQLIGAHSTREVLELRFSPTEQSAAAEKLATASLSGRSGDAARPAALLHRGRRDRAGRGARTRAAPGDRPGPALHIGGCVPRPDRPHAGGLTMPTIRWRCASSATGGPHYIRTWRGIGGDQRGQPVAVPRRDRRRARAAGQSRTPTRCRCHVPGLLRPGHAGRGLDAERYRRVGVSGQPRQDGWRQLRRWRRPARSSRWTSWPGTCCSWPYGWR